MHIKNTIELYDAYENVTAYMIDCSNNMGYVVVNANRTNAIILEFSETSKNPYNSLPLSKNFITTSDKLYYFGFNNVFAKNDTISFNVLSGDVLDASSFNFMSDEFTQSMRGTAPNVPITRPEDYESGYSSITSKNVSNYNQTYQKKLTLWVLIIVGQQL